MGRRNITDEQKTVLIGEAYKAQKMTLGGDRKSNDQIGHLINGTTRKEIAKQFSVGEMTVQRAENYVDGLNAAEEVSPGIKEAVLSGTVKAPKQMIAEIRNAPEGKRAEAVKAIREGDTDTAKAVLRPIPKHETEAMKKSRTRR